MQNRDDMLGRRTLLKLTGIATSVGLGGSALAGRASAHTTDDITSGMIESIDCNTTVSGELTADDQSKALGGRAFDAYRISGDAGEFASFSLSTPDGDGRTPRLLVFGPDGSTLATTSGPVVLSESGPHTIAVMNYRPEEFFSYDLAVRCTEGIESEPIECGETLSGELTDDDSEGVFDPNAAVDVYHGSGDAGETLSVQMSTSGAGAPMLSLISPDGRVVRDADARRREGGGARLRHTLQQRGEYQIVATSLAPDERFSYDLSLECISLDAREIECGDTVSAELSADDQTGFIGTNHLFDAYRLQAAAGEMIDLRMYTETEDQPWDGDPELRLIGPDGRVVASDYDGGGGTEAKIVRRLVDDGEYTIIATESGAPLEFEYTLETRCASEERIIGEPEPIECGDILSGELTRSDTEGFRGPGYVHDAYRFSADAGDHVNLWMQPVNSRESDYLYLLDPDGEIVPADYLFDGFIDVTLPADGEYTIVATSYGPGTLADGREIEERFFEYDIGLQCTEERFYQVDFVAGPPEQRLGESPDDFYSDQERLIRFLHGTTEAPITRQGAPSTLDRSVADCVDTEQITIDDRIVTVEFTVAEGCHQELSLASYTKPEAGWSRETAERQRLFFARTEEFGPGTHRLRVLVPSGFGPLSLPR